MDTFNPYEVTTAEYLIELARTIRLPGEKIVVAQPDMAGWMVEQCKTALDFDAKPMEFKFRALYEEWDQERIVRELY